MGGHSYILLYLVTETNIKMTVLSYSCHRSSEWQVKLIKIIDKYSSNTIIILIKISKEMH